MFAINSMTTKRAQRAKRAQRTQRGSMGSKSRSIYYEDVYGRPDIDRDDVQGYMIDLCDSSSNEEDNGEEDNEDNDKKGHKSHAGTIVTADVIYESIENPRCKSYPRPDNDLQDASSCWPYPDGQALPVQSEDNALPIIDNSKPTASQTLYRISPSQNSKSSIRVACSSDSGRNRTLVQRLGMFAAVPLNVDWDAVDQSEEDIVEQRRRLLRAQRMDLEEGGGQDLVEQHQQLPIVKRTAASRQQRSERIKQRCAMTEKARKFRDAVTRRSAKRVADIRDKNKQDKAERKAEKKHGMGMSRTRASSPDVLIEVKEVMEATGHLFKDGKTGASSPYVLVEAYKP